jgi:hypothetical protein
MSSGRWMCFFFCRRSMGRDRLQLRQGELGRMNKQKGDSKRSQARPGLRNKRGSRAKAGRVGTGGLAGPPLRRIDERIRKRIGTRLVRPAELGCHARPHPSPGVGFSGGKAMFTSGIGMGFVCGCDATVRSARSSASSREPPDGKRPIRVVPRFFRRIPSPR